MKQKKLIALLVALFVTATVSSVAQASSYYDSRVTATDHIAATSVEGTTDLTVDWERVFTGTLESRNSTTDQQMLSQFHSNKTVGTGWYNPSTMDCGSSPLTLLQPLVLRVVRTTTTLHSALVTSVSGKVGEPAGKIGETLVHRQA